MTVTKHPPKLRVPHPTKAAATVLEIGLRLLRRLDFWIAFSFLIGGACLAATIIRHAGVAYIYIGFMPEVVYHACGFGWVRAETLPPQLLDFLFLRSQAFDCSALSRPEPALSRGTFFESQLYLAMVTDWIWRLSSVAFRNLWPVAASLAGAYACGCFAFLRLFFSRWLAVLGATILTLSPIMLSMVVSIRDYSKAPFFIWSLVILIVSVRANSGRSAIGLAAAAGATVGLGYGFRVDTIIMLPIGILFLALVGPTRGRLSRSGAAAAFAAATLLVASPMFAARNGGGFGSLLMQGLTEPYQNYLGLGLVPYSFGSKYSDELTLSMIAADLSANDSGWAAHEARPGDGMTQAVLRSGPYVLGWLPYFSADLATQSLKSGFWILGLPALTSQERRSHDWKLPIPDRPPIAAPLTKFYDLIGRSTLPWLVLAGIFIFLWQSFGERRTEAIALGLTFAGLLAYTVVQFALRNVFHLEFFWVVGLLAILRLPFFLRPMRETAGLFLPAVMFFAIAMAALRFGLVLYQDHALKKELRHLLSLPRDDVAFERLTASETRTVVKVPVPERYNSLVEGPADAMDNTMGQRGTQWEVIASADRLLVSIDPKACPNGTMQIKIRYAKRPAVWQPLDYDVTIELKNASKTQLVVPALYRATQHFEGIEVDTPFAPCIDTIERIVGEKNLPIALTFVLSPDWQSKPLHRAFGSLESSGSEPDHFRAIGTFE